MGRIPYGTMHKRRDGMVHTVMPTGTAAHGSMVRYEDTHGIHYVSVSDFLQDFEPLDPSAPPPTVWDHLMED